MKTLGITIGALALSYVAFKLWSMLSKDRAAMASIPDDYLINHYKWELAEGRDGRKYAQEYKRRHGNLPC